MSFNYQVVICALSGEKLNGENCHSTLGTAEKKTEILLYARLTKLGVLYGELGEPDRRYRSEDEYTSQPERLPSTCPTFVDFRMSWNILERVIW